MNVMSYLGKTSFHCTWYVYQHNFTVTLIIMKQSPDLNNEKGIQ